MVTSADLLAVGRFGRAHGVRGWINVYSLEGETHDLVRYQPWYLLTSSSSSIACKQDQFVKLELAEKRLLDGKLQVRLAGCATVEQAREYTNRLIYVSKTVLPALKAGEYYWHQLIGLQVFGLDGYLGEVQDLIATGVHDVLVAVKGARRILIPYVGQVIKEISLADGRIEVEWASDYL